MSNYNQKKEKFLLNLMDEIDEHFESGNLVEFLEQEKGHSDIHVAKTDEELVERASKEFKVAATYLSKSKQSEALYQALGINFDKIEKWLFDDTSKKLIIEHKLKTPIGNAIDLFLNKYEVNKIKIALTRDPESNLKFRLTTNYPFLDKEGTDLNIKFKRKYKEPRMLKWFSEITNEKNKPYYNATMCHAGTTINITNIFDNKKYSVQLLSDSKIPKFYIEDRKYNECLKISESEFLKEFPEFKSSLNKYKEIWAKEEIAYPRKNLNTLKNKANILEKYCNNNNLNYASFENLSDQKYNNAMHLAMKSINPEILLREDITDEISNVISKQLQYNLQNEYNNNFYNVNIEYYLSSKCIYSDKQLETLFKASARGLDTKLLENKNLNSEQMEIISKGLNYVKNHPNCNIDFSLFAKPNVEKEKMKQILDNEINESKRIGENFFKNNNYYKEKSEKNIVLNNRNEIEIEK